MQIRRWHIALVAALFLLTSGPADAALVSTGAVVITTAPNAPSDLTAVPDSSTQVTLSWTDNAGGAEDGFIVQRKAGVAGTYATIGTTSSSVATYVDDAAAPATTYFYQVAAFQGLSVSNYSNESSVTTPSNSSPPVAGGGGGGGYIPPATTTTDITIAGWAYPLSTVTLLENGIQVLQTIADPTGAFSGGINNLTPGTYQFYLYATDSVGRRSTPFTFPVTIAAGVTTNIGHIFLAPTIGIDKQEVKQGDPLLIFGQTLPSVSMQIQVDSVEPVIAYTSSTASGTYSYYFDTGKLALGSHVAKSESMSGGLISNYSIAQSFTVGDQDIAALPAPTCPPKGDFNGDCRVNLIDFSILAYWYGKPNPPAKYLIDGASTVDLRDFSIMAYYWTG